MNEAELAGLKRKHAATEEIAKKQELAHQLRQAGVDPETGEKYELEPLERTGPRVFKTVQEKPEETEKSKTSRATTDDSGARPSRATAKSEAKTETKSETKSATKSDAKGKTSK